MAVGEGENKGRSVSLRFILELIKMTHATWESGLFCLRVEVEEGEGLLSLESGEEKGMVVICKEGGGLGRRGRRDSWGRLGGFPELRSRFPDKYPFRVDALRPVCYSLSFGLW